MRRVLLPLLSASIVIAIWHVAVIATHTKIFPSPMAVAKAIGHLAEGSLLWRYIGDSLFRVAAGYLTAVLLGIPIGLLLGWYPTAGRAFNPLIQMLRPISPLAWMPLAVIWFGVSNMAPMFLIFLASFFHIIVAAMNGVRNVPPMYLQAGRNFGLTTPQLIVRVVLPAMGAGHHGGAHGAQRQLVDSDERPAAGGEAQAERGVYPGDVTPGVPGDGLHLRLLAVGTSLHSAPLPGLS